MKRIGMLFVALALSATAASAQNTAVYWSAFDQGFAAPRSSGTMVRSVTGQAFVGLAQSGATRHEAGFLANTLLRGAASDTGVIVYSRTGATRTIWMRASDGSFDTMVISGGAWPRLSHNGRYILFHKGNGDPVHQGMFLYDLQTRRDTLLQANSDFLVCYDWFDDDYRIVFDQVCGVYTINRDLTGFTTLYQASCTDDAPVTRPGSWAIAHHNTFTGILVTDSLGVNRRAVPNTSAGDYWPSWSRDGQWIAFMRRLNDTTYNYYKIRPDGSGLTALTTFTTVQATFEAGGAWTPDGSKIIVAGRINGVRGIYAIATDGSHGIGLVQTSPGDPVDFVGTVTGNVNVQLTAVEEQRNHIPLRFELLQNYPNPFNPSTKIAFIIPVGTGHAPSVLKVYDVLGREVATLVNEVKGPGSYEVTWDATGVASGVYFYRLEAGNFVQTKKLVLLR